VRLYQNAGFAWCIPRYNARLARP